MKLTDLRPQFVRFERNDEGTLWRPTDRIEDAHGILFLCPKCFAEKGGEVGCHSVICWSRSRGVPDDASPGPGRWALNGTGYADLTLDADPPNTARSVQLNGGCDWHGHVTNGEAA